MKPQLTAANQPARPSTRRIMDLCDYQAVQAITIPITENATVPDEPADLASTRHHDRELVTA